MPRWTPYQDRAEHRQQVLDAALEEEEASSASPTASQQAKKRLGFENLFDQTDPDVSDIDDVVGLGLCSGVFASQKPLQGGSPASQETDAVGEVVRQTQADFQDSRPPSRNLDTQDTVILTGAAPSLPSFPPLASLTSPAATPIASAIHSILADIPAEEESEEEEEEEEAELANPDLESDDEPTEEEERVKVSKKRKRRLISDSEGSEEEKEEKGDEGRRRRRRRREMKSDDEPTEEEERVKVSKK